LVVITVIGQPSLEIRQEIIQQGPPQITEPRAAMPPSMVTTVPVM
jgi:hypothetical protein